MRSGSFDYLGKEIDNLVQAGWKVVDSNYDPAAFRDWRQKIAQVRILLTDDELPQTRLVSETKGSIENS